MDAMAGVLTGAAFARDLASEPATAGNATFWALDVEAFMAREEFLARMEAQIDEVKAGERLAGVLDGNPGCTCQGLRIPVYRPAARPWG
jgi:LDH2 family malate/lactate/ureidoglycolate dehydrogenase